MPATQTEAETVTVSAQNRNFPGRVHPQLEAGFLASPPMVVAFALAALARDLLLAQLVVAAVVLVSGGSVDRSSNAGLAERGLPLVDRAAIIPKQLDGHGISVDNMRVDDEALDQIIGNYTREAGVRNLERRIADVCRGVAVQVAEALSTADEGEVPAEVSIDITPENLDDYLGPRKYSFEVAQRVSQPGVATGLAWTAAGGDILFIEATKMHGKGELLLTGQLGDVMKESVRAALSYIRSRTEEFGIAIDAFRTSDIHLHVPAGAIPKDGPSAGITMFIALLSLLTGVKVRPDVAMTGEITLRGNVLPVGGIKEKVLAAHRSGIRRVVLPERNKKDLVDVNEDIQKELEFFFVDHVVNLPQLVFEESPLTQSGPPTEELIHDTPPLETV